MNKNRVTRFIQKYNLAGLVESVSWKAENGKLIVEAQDFDKQLANQKDGIEISGNQATLDKCVV